ncbi:zf-TFIIB domain-containing protein, partial [candidate division WOR-3 bacterium]|nr:zf-TFIIB domain-containing protein [candidate division WOR-3 bacterium]
EYEGLYVWRCAFCNGVLGEGNKLPRIFVRKEKGFTERVQRFAQLLSKNAKKRHPHFDIRLSVSHLRKCPKCGKNMVHKFYSYAYHIEIDTCSACNVTWFDLSELEILQCLIEMEEKE